MGEVVARVPVVVVVEVAAQPGRKTPPAQIQTMVHVSKSSLEKVDLMIGDRYVESD